MGIKGLEQVIANLNGLDRTMVPTASVWAINRVAQRAVTSATRKVAKDAVVGDNRVKGIPVRKVRERIKLRKASTKGRATAWIKVNRGDMPAIALGAAQVRLTRRKGALLKRGSVLRVGKYLFRDAFIQQLANGRWHVMRRTAGNDSLPIEVVKIPLAKALTDAFETERDRMIDTEMPKQLAAALKQQIRLHFTR